MRLTCARLPSATASPPPSPRAIAAGGASASLRSKAPSPSRCSTPSRSAPCSRSTGSASGRSASRAPAAAASSRAARALSQRDAAGGIDPQSVYDYLYFHMVPSPRTIHLGVEKLLPGQYAVFENGRLEKGFYWRMRYGADGATKAQL